MSSLESKGVIADEAILIGEFRFEPSRNRIIMGREIALLEPRLVKILLLLCRRYGHTVTREEILSEVWADVVVTDISLTRAVSDLRKILKDSSEHSTVISTVRKVGYRLLIEPKPIGKQVQPMKGVYGRVGWVVLVMLVVLATWRFVRQGRLETSWMPVATSIENESFATLTADGMKVAYVRGGREIWVWDDEAKKPRMLLNWHGDIQNLTWTPSMSTIVFTSTVEKETSFFKMFAVPGAEPIPVVSVPTEYCPGIEAVGETEVLASVAGDDHRFRIVRIDLLSGGIETMIEPYDSTIGLVRPKLSPDGSRIAFIEMHSFFRCRLGVADRDFANIEYVTSGDHSIYSVDWLNNGRLVFIATLAHVPKIYIKDLHSNNAFDEVIEAGLFPLTLDTSSGAMVVDDANIDADIVQFIDGQGVVRISDSVLMDMDSDVAPGRSEIVFVSMRNDARGLFRSNVGWLSYSIDSLS